MVTTDIFKTKGLMNVTVFHSTPLFATHTVDGQKVPNVHRRLICQKVSVSRNHSQKVVPSDEDFSFLYLTFSSEVITFRKKWTKVKPSTLDENFFNSAVMS